MFADAGYGLVLTLACFLGVKLLKPSESMERFLKMFGYCGISCMVCGVLFGAYFGDLPLAIMKNMMGIPEAELPNLALLGASAANVALLFDPLQNPMAFLIVSLGIGAVHLIAGMAVKFVLLCREGHPIDAILDIGAYWLLFAGIGLLFLLPSVGLWMTIGAAVLIVLTHGRSEKNPVMKILKGFLGLYDLISYVSDLLSYSRILALGLAAGVIAQVVNILGTMGGPTPVGFIALVVAFVIGHLLNIAINVLGTFVHTSRLQYIEFFNKFYEDGGVPFEPALPSEKYTEE
jgi:V/A-type H+-transporting ATPase subunit I